MELPLSSSRQAPKTSLPSPSLPRPQHLTSRVEVVSALRVDGVTRLPPPVRPPPVTGALLVCIRTRYPCTLACFHLHSTPTTPPIASLTRPFFRLRSSNINSTSKPDYSDTSSPRHSCFKTRLIEGDSNHGYYSLTRPFQAFLLINASCKSLTCLVFSSLTRL